MLTRPTSDDIGSFQEIYIAQCPDEIIPFLEEQRNSFASFIDQLTDEQLTYRYAPEKWSIQENLAHLGRYQEIFSERLERILTENEPEFGRYRAEDDADFENWTKKKTFEIMHKTKQARRKIADKLLSINKTQLARTFGVYFLDNIL